MVSVVRLPRLVPRARLRSSYSLLEHQRAGRADADAVAAVDARGVGQRDVGLGRDAGVEAAAGDRDGEGVLGVGAAGLDALVAEDALPVVANVEVVVDLHRLRDGLRGAPVGRVVMAGLARVALARRGRRVAAARSARGGRRSGCIMPRAWGAVERSTDEARNSSTILRDSAHARRVGADRPSPARPAASRPGPACARRRARPRRPGRR